MGFVETLSIFQEIFQDTMSSYFLHPLASDFKILIVNKYSSKIGDKVNFIERLIIQMGSFLMLFMAILWLSTCQVKSERRYVPITTIDCLLQLSLLSI